MSKPQIYLSENIAQKQQIRTSSLIVIGAAPYVTRLSKRHERCLCCFTASRLQVYVLQKELTYLNEEIFDTMFIKERPELISLT